MPVYLSQCGGRLGDPPIPKPPRWRLSITPAAPEGAAGSIAALGAALLTVSAVSRVLSAGVGALSGVFGAFAGVASALAGKGVVVQGAFSLMARAFADYRNAAIPAMVGTSREINANSDKIADAMKKVADVRRRLAAIEEDDEEALTGVLRPTQRLPSWASIGNKRRQ